MGKKPRNIMGGMFHDYVSLTECKIEWPSGWYQSSIVSWWLKVSLRILSTWRSLRFIHKNTKEVKPPTSTFQWLNAWLVKRCSHLGWKHILSNQLNGVNIHLKTDTNIHLEWMLGRFSRMASGFLPQHPRSCEGSEGVCFVVSLLKPVSQTCKGS